MTLKTDSDVMWQPSPDEITASRLWDFRNWVMSNSDISLKNYQEIWHWSVSDLPSFWNAVRQYFEVIGDGFDSTKVVKLSDKPPAEWYPGARVNFSENVLKYAQQNDLKNENAIVRVEEDGTQVAISWSDLERQVASLAGYYRSRGVKPGDIVAAVLPNVPEAIIGLLAASAVGAIWTINSPDLSSKATLQRLKQLNPSVLLLTDGYMFKGTWQDTTAARDDIIAGLPGVHTVIDVGPEKETSVDGQKVQYISFARTIQDDIEPTYERVEFNHPLWVLFSSGTTGAPKGIVHSQGGMLLEALKGTGLNQDMGPGDLYYVAANTSWMVWNTLVNNLASGASVVTYAGSPTLNSPDHQFKIISETGTTMFATGAAYLTLVEKTGLQPKTKFDLSSLRSVLSTGSPLPEKSWRWVHDAVKQDVHLGSDTGGTDICSGFIGSNPLEPVHLGQLQGPLLGVAVEAWNPDGQKVVNEMGELVVTQPMPSMPIYLWGDSDNLRYEETYYEKFGNVWAQGDWVTELPNGGFIVHGRSDATLNRQGVRIGSAEIYNAVGFVEEIQESLVVGVEIDNGGYYMPLFVSLREGQVLTKDLESKIQSTIRQHTSARHVPDKIIEAPGVPMNHANKRLEIPVKKLFIGGSSETVVNRESIANPDIWDWYVNEATTWHGNQEPIIRANR